MTRYKEQACTRAMLLQPIVFQRDTKKMQREKPSDETNGQGGKDGGVPTKTTPTPMG